MAETSIKLVAFIDILGFSQLISDYDSGKDRDIFTVLKSALDPAADFIKKGFMQGNNDLFFEWRSCLEAKLFSDCLCVAAPLEYLTYGFGEQLSFFYKYLMAYQNLLMEHGFFTRGAVTIGSHYSDENLIFSGGLVEAYNLETKICKYPRIMASDALMGEIFKLGRKYKSSLGYMLELGNDGIFFFNHFNYNIIDSKVSDMFSKDFLSLLGFEGLMESFYDIDIKKKNEELNKKKAIAESKLFGLEPNGSVAEKYKWFISFIDYQLGGENPLGFRDFSKI